MPVANYGYAAMFPGGQLIPWCYGIRSPGSDEILMRVLYSGICHSDIHMVKNEWGITKYPIVPGHEFVGLVHKVGSAVTRFSVGDRIGVGVLVDSCQDCENCKAGFEQHCPSQVDTYAGYTRGERTYGGYGAYVVVRHQFAIKIPDGLDITRCAPLLCAGITTYSPIMKHNMGRGNLKIAVVGFGGLGHMAVQFAKKVNLSNIIYVLSRSMFNKQDLAKQFGAEGVIIPSREEHVAQHESTFDYIIDTVSVSNKPLDQYMRLLKPRGTMITVGIPPVDEIVRMPVKSMVMKSASIEGSLIGGIKETQEMMHFCEEHNVLPMVELISMNYVNQAYERVLRGDVKFRFVLKVSEQNDPYNEMEPDARSVDEVDVIDSEGS